MIQGTGAGGPVQVLVFLVADDAAFMGIFSPLSLLKRVVGLSERADKEKPQKPKNTTENGNNAVVTKPK